MCKEDQDRMSRLVLERIYYPVLTLGYGKRLGVWVRGCSRFCPGCISPDLQSYTGDAVDVHKLIQSVPDGFQADGMTISGGEPFDRTEGLEELVCWFAENVSEDILIYTGYTIEELQARGDKMTDCILKNTAVLVDSPYIASLNDGRGIRGSSNQRVFVWKYPERYQGAEVWERQVQFVAERDSLLQIGVPPGKGYGIRT